MVLVPAGRHFSNYFRPDSAPPPIHMNLQRKKANSLVPAIFFPIAWPFWKKGRGWYWYTFFFSLSLGPLGMDLRCILVATSLTSLRMRLCPSSPSERACKGLEKSREQLSVRHLALAIAIAAFFFGVATPAEPRGEKKKLFLCKFWAVKNF